MQNEKMDELINSVGSLAEMLWLFYSQLKRTGFEDGAAFGLCVERLHCLVMGRPNDAE